VKDDLGAWKLAAAESAVDLLSDGMVVGLGTGSTAAFALKAVARRIQGGLRITGIPTSERTAGQARALEIPISTLAEHPHIDVTIDGADEVETGSLNLIKGHGGALLREKIVANASQRLAIIVDQTKIVSRLGTRESVPIEVIPFGWNVVALRLSGLGGNPVLRKEPNGEPFKSDGGHFILDCAFGPIQDVKSLADELDRMVGVVEHGLFLGMASEVRVGGPEGVQVVTG
jgi:ribose 5-phosphate isomerase A